MSDLRKGETKRFATPQTNHSPRRFKLLPAGNAAHVGQMVGDTLVAVDAGLLAREQEAPVRHRGPRRLLCDVHGIGAMAFSTSQIAVRIKAPPSVRLKLEPVIQKLLAGVDRAENLAP